MVSSVDRHTVLTPSILALAFGLAASSCTTAMAPAGVHPSTNGTTSAMPVSSVDGHMVKQRRDAIDRFVGQFADLAMFDGTILVEQGGKRLYQQSFGKASYEFDVSHTNDTRFRIASLSKTLTDVALSRMIQHGTIDLDSPLSHYLPQFPSATRITLEHLVSHRSGIAHTNNQPWGDGKKSMTLDELLDRLAALPLDFEPGTTRRYSNGGYAVLAKVIEIAGNGSYKEVMKKTVFEPLGMNDTGHINHWREPVFNIATGYEPGEFPGERRFPRFYAVETRPGGGSLYSTVPDLLRFARAIFRDDFVRGDLRGKIVGDADPVFLAQGRSPGFIGRLYYNSDDDLFVISLANNYAVPADWTPAIADLATGKVAWPSWPQVVRFTDTVEPGHPWIGRYTDSYGDEEMMIKRSKRGALVLVDAQHDEPATALIPLADGTFLLPIYYQRCERDADSGAITCKILSGDKRYTNVLTPVDAPQR